MRRGILLAGGYGTRLYPTTIAISKHLLPIYDKPMIFYPLSTLMLSNIRDILVISTPEDLPRFIELIGDGSRLGMNISYAEQAAPRGIAEGLLIGKTFLGDKSSALILGDNIFFGQGMPALLQKANTQEHGATIFAHRVADPENFGVVSFDESKTAVLIEEKPIAPKTNYAVTGLYFYDNRAPEIASELVESDRGELEITDLNMRYLVDNKLSVEVLGRGYSWLDTGTHDNLLAAGSFISTLQARQGLHVGCPEEAALINGWITKESILQRAHEFGDSNYARYLKQLAEL